MNSLRIYSSLPLPSKVTNSAVMTHLPKFMSSPDSNDLKIKTKSLRLMKICSRNYKNGGYMASDPHLIMGQLIAGGMIMGEDTTMVHPSEDTTYEMRLILEEVADRIEMHHNIGNQRDNWNMLLLNSINAMTLTATTMAGLACVTDGGDTMKLSSTLLFGAATALLLVMNKIQPSQLAEEQRNATRLFKQMKREIQSMLVLGTPTVSDVEETMERVLAVDRAYPLPLLGKMLEKFPKKFDSAKWWPNQSRSTFKKLGDHDHPMNGWSHDLEKEMRAIVDVLKRKDEEDYLRLGSIALKVNKVLAIAGPALTGLAAVASAFAAGTSSSTGVETTAGALTVTAGALAAVVNTFEHGGQVGMVLEMYRNCAGFFKLLSESIESTLEEKDWERRENGEVFTRKVALKLGRSLSELKNLAETSSLFSEEFGSKLF